MEKEVATGIVSPTVIGQEGTELHPLATSAGSGMSIRRSSQKAVRVTVNVSAGWWVVRLLGIKFPKVSM